MKFIKIIFLLAIAFTTVFAQLDRTVQPKPGPAPEIKIGDYESFEMENGLKVFVIENDKLPKVNFDLILDRDPILEGEHIGYIELAGNLLRRGTKNRTKEQIDEQVDFIGARLSTRGSGMSGSSLKKHFPTLMEIFSDVLLNSEFKQEELDKLKQQTISGIASGKDDPNSIAANVKKAVVYGHNHPYGEVMTEKSIKSITLEMCQKYYEDNFRPNVAYLVFVGDITVDEAKDLTEKYLAKWEKKEVAKFEYKTPKAPLVRKVAISDRPASVQSVVTVAYPVNLKKGSEDVIPASVMSTILGGSFSSRLNQNLREQHAYTYGAGGRLSPDEYVGSFTASATVRNEVTDSSVAEIFNEMTKLRTELVGEAELTRIKNYLTGSFSRSLEQPSTIARFALNIARYNLPKDYYKNYLKNLNSVTAEDIKKVAKKYLKPKNSNVIIVGNAEEVANGLKRFSTSGKMQYYDYKGDKYDPNVKKVDASITPESVIEKYIEATGGREKLESIKDKTMILKGAAQGMNMTLTISQKAPNKLYQSLDFSVGKQVTVFDGEKGKIEAMGQVQMLEGDKLEELKYQAQIAPYLNYAEQGITLQLKGMEKIDEEEAYQIILTDKNGKKYTQYYSVETGYKLRETSQLDTPQGSFTQTMDMRDYKDVDGIKYPFKLVQQVGPQTIELDVESIKVNSGLADSLFEVK